MSEVLYSGQISAETLTGLIAACDFSSDALMLIEQLPAHVLGKPADRDNLLLFDYFEPETQFSEYTSGRIFRDDSELRWEKQGEEFRVVYLGSEANSAALLRCGLRNRTDDVLGQIGSKPRPTLYALFGERLGAQDLQTIRQGAQPGEYFAEARIPRLLHYPIKQGRKPYVQLKVLEYFDETGQVVMYRFQGLKELIRESHESI